MAITAYKLAAIRADYEAGVDTKSNIAIKYKINRLSLARNALKLGWEYAKSNANVTDIITQNATKKIVEDETNKLINLTTVHLKNIKTLRSLSVVNTSELVKKAKKDLTLSDIDRKEAERLLAIQKVIELSTKTHDLIFKSERLAMGLGKEADGEDNDVDSKINTRMNKLKDAYRSTV